MDDQCGELQPRRWATVSIGNHTTEGGAEGARVVRTENSGSFAASVALRLPLGGVIFTPPPFARALPRAICNRDGVRGTEDGVRRGDAPRASSRRGESGPEVPSVAVLAFISPSCSVWPSAS